MKKLFKSFIVVFVILLAVSAIFALFFEPFEQKQELSLSQLAQKVERGQITKITVTEDELQALDQAGETFISRKEKELAISEFLLNYGISEAQFGGLEIEIKEKGGLSAWLGPIMFLVLPFLLIFAFFFLMFRQAKGGAMQAFNFTKARAQLFGAEGHPKQKITFKDVAGLKEAKEELKEVIDFLKYPKKYFKIGAKIPKGVLLMGPAGSGKTLLARAVAGESNVPFFSVSGSSFVELFVGVGSGRVRSLFQEAKKRQPCLIFIDELDAIGKTRGPGFGGGHDEREQTLNQILVEMDGFEPKDQLVVLAATNRGDTLDSALLRPGRFDRKVILDLPDVNGREAILKIHSQGKPLALDVKLREIAERTPGFSGADLANLVNEAAIFAARRNKEQVYQEEFLESIEKVLLGPERKSHVLSKGEKKIAAYHEAGHALVSSKLSKQDPVRKISIISRGMAAGYTLRLPTEERKMKTKSEFMAELATFLGGYIAEEIKFGEITTGASNDLQQASDLARRLVKEYGMSSLGPITFGKKNQMMFLGRDFGEDINYSEKIASQIDKEVAKFIKQAQAKAKKVLVKNKGLLERIAQTLITKETIEKQEFEQLLTQEKPAEKGTRYLPGTQKGLNKHQKSVKVRIARV